MVSCLISGVGCATAELSEAAQSVKTISEAQSKSCTFVDTISANNMNTLSRDPKIDARNRAFNEVAKLGGNALYIKNTETRVSPSGVGSTYIITGDVYRC